MGISMSGNADFQVDMSAEALEQLQSQAMNEMMSKMEELCLVMCLVGVGATFAATLQGACFKIFSELQRLCKGRLRGFRARFRGLQAFFGRPGPLSTASSTSTSSCSRTSGGIVVSRLPRS